MTDGIFLLPGSSNLPMKLLSRSIQLVGALLWAACGPEEPSEPAPTPEYTKAPTADYAVGRGRQKGSLRCALSM